MSFAAPWALVGLVFAAVPILLHLLARREPPTVLFPATRYLARAAREHQRRLQLQHLLLLLLRTLLIAAIALAAAGPSRPSGSSGAHAPSALAVVVDNSMSSGVVRAGVPLLDGLKDAAREALRRSTPADRLWVITVDGIARHGTASELAEVVSGLRAEPRRMDLGQALEQAHQLLAVAGLPGEALLLSDLQRSALGQGEPPKAVAVLRPSGDAVANAGVGRVSVGVQPWGVDAGAVGVLVVGTGAGSRPVAIGFVDRPAKQLLVPVGGQGTARLASPGPGWWALEARLDPDELRADDRWMAAVRVSPAARVAWRPEARYLATAAEVLADNGRVQPGTDVSLGWLGPGPSIVVPPEDPAAIGALNRALAARGSRWRFGDLELAPTTTDSGAWVGRERVTRRYRLTFAGGVARDILVTAGGEPWLVRSDSILLLGSRLEPDWTAVPLSAGFVPFVDAMVNRAARGEILSFTAAPGDPVPVPDRVTSVAGAAEARAIEGGSAYRPVELGIHYLLAGRDTIGAIAVNPDPRESDLTPATDAEVRALWPGARVAPLEEVGTVAFAAGARSDLRGPLLWLVAGLLLGEAALASGRARRAR
jgi:hypothetical protein